MDKNLPVIKATEGSMSPKKKQRWSFSKKEEKLNEISTPVNKKPENIEDVQLSIRLCMFREGENCSQSPEKKQKESPSVRVRRLLKQ